MGTPGYYAPELTDSSLAKKLVKLEPADIWGLGIIVLQITMGSLCVRFHVKLVSVLRLTITVGSGQSGTRGVEAHFRRSS